MLLCNKNVSLLIKTQNDTINTYLKSNHIGKTREMKSIKSKYSDYQNMLYCYDAHTLDQIASFASLYICMNKWSRIDSKT